MNTQTDFRAAVLFTLAGVAASAWGQATFPEIEPNHTKDLALSNGPFVLSVGDGVTGITTGNVTSGPGVNSADYFLIRTTAAPPGIYRHRITVDLVDLPGALSVATAGTIRGLLQGGGGPLLGTDALVQTSSSVQLVPRTVQWYGFGKQEQIFYRVTGGATTTGNYLATLTSSEEIVPVDLGLFHAGEIAITTKGWGATNNTNLWVLDANFDPIPNFGNSDIPVGVGPDGSVRSLLMRSFAPGTYYLGVSNTNMALSLIAPFDDRILTSNMLDFPNAILTSSNVANVSVGFAITDEYGPVHHPGMIPSTQLYTIMWYRFEVGDASADAGACCLPDGTCALLRHASCDVLEGSFGGAGSVCGAAPCDQPGACCILNEGCVTRSAAQCAAVAGATYGGNGSQCGTTPCASPIVRIGQFVPDVQEGFENAAMTGNGIAPFLAMGDLARFASTAASEQVGLLENGHSFMCFIHQSNVPAVVTRLFTSTVGGLKIDFEPGSGGVAKFGAYLAGNAAEGHRCHVEFYDDSGLIGETLATWDNDCSWSWNAWEFTTPVTRIILRSAPRFNGTHVFMALPQVVWHEGPPPCYANCDGSTTPPVLNVEDFTCFINEFALASILNPSQQLTHYANCDGSSTEPILNVEDFTCFINAFAQGCP